MKRIVLLALAVVLVCGCSSSPSLNLSQVQPRRIFALTKEAVFDAVRFYAMKQDFNIQSQELERGRILGYRTFVYRESPDPKVVIMNLKVTLIDRTHTEVLASFTFSKMNDALTREEENILVDEYGTLFNYLESKAD